MAYATEMTSMDYGGKSPTGRHIAMICLAFLIVTAAIVVGFFTAIFPGIISSGGGDKNGDHEGDFTKPTGNVYIDATKPTVAATKTTASAAPTATTSTGRPTTMKEFTTRPDTRSFLFCTVGAGLKDAEVIEKGWCEYIVYSDLTVSGSDLVPTASDSSWSVFQAAASGSKISRGGVAFSTAHQTSPHGTVSRIGEFRQELKGLIKNGILALGLLHYTFDSTQTDHKTILARVFAEFKNRLGSKKGAMTFLGVRLYRSIQIQTFISAIPDVATVDTIIFQTHMADPVSGKSACRTRFLSISAESWQGTQPSLDVAYSAVKALRQQKPNLAKVIRSLFSATLGVMIYTGTIGGGNFTMSGQECIWGGLRGHDELCKEKVRKATSFHSGVDMADYALYSDRGVPYFIALESTPSLEDKVKKYAKTLKASQGWAMFDVHLDQNKKCDDPRNFERLSIFNLSLKA